MRLFVNSVVLADDNDDHFLFSGALNEVSPFSKFISINNGEKLSATSKVDKGTTFDIYIPT